MTPAAPVHPRHHAWMGHEFWATVLVLLAVATLVGAILCTIY
jgi:hypothetical protein